MPTTLEGNLDTGRFVISDGHRVAYKGDVRTGEFALAIRLRVDTWLQSGEMVYYEAGEYPYTEARERFRRDYVRGRVRVEVAASFDPKLLDDTRRRAAARLNERLASSDAALVREVLSGLPVKDADLTLDFGGVYGEIVDELRNKPRM